MKIRFIVPNLVLLFTISVMTLGCAVPAAGSGSCLAFRTGCVLPSFWDAGHGGEDGGAVGVGGVVEKDINLAIAQNLRDLLVMNGYTVVMTRNSDAAIYSSGAGGRSGKRRFLTWKNRLLLMKENPGSIFVSIHQNQFWLSDLLWDTSFFTVPTQRLHKSLAEIIQANARSNLDESNNREIKEVGDEIFLLKNAPNYCCDGRMRFSIQSGRGCQANGSGLSKASGLCTGGVDQRIPRRERFHNEKKESPMAKSKTAYVLSKTADMNPQNGTENVRSAANGIQWWSSSRLLLPSAERGTAAAAVTTIAVEPIDEISSTEENRFSHRSLRIGPRARWRHRQRLGNSAQW